MISCNLTKGLSFICLSSPKRKHLGYDMVISVNYQYLFTREHCLNQSTASLCRGEYYTKIVFSVTDSICLVQYKLQTPCGVANIDSKPNIICHSL